METLVFFRDDDVGEASPSLLALAGLFLERGVPLTLAVIPLSLSPQVAAWLQGPQGRALEIIQHGYAHTWHGRGEFGGRRGYQAQREEIAAGKRLLEEHFGERFFPAMAFPWHLYNRHAIAALQELGFRVMSGIYDPTTTRRLFFGLGRALGVNRLLGRNVSYHGRCRPGTAVREISVSLDPLLGYVQPAQQAPHRTLDELKAGFQWCRARTGVIGVLLHHAAYEDSARLDILAAFLDWVRGQEGVRLANLRQINDLLADGQIPGRTP